MAAKWRQRAGVGLHPRRFSKNLSGLLKHCILHAHAECHSMSEHWTGKYPNSHKVPKSKRSKFSNSHSSKDICWQWVSKSHCWQLSTLPSLMEAKVFNSRAMYCRSSTFSSSEVNRFSTAAWYSPTYITRSDAIPSVNPRLAMTTEDWTIWHCVLLYRHQKRRGWIWSKSNVTTHSISTNPAAPFLMTM